MRAHEAGQKGERRGEGKRGSSLAALFACLAARLKEHEASLGRALVCAGTTDGPWPTWWLLGIFVRPHVAQAQQEKNVLSLAPFSTGLYTFANSLEYQQAVVKINKQTQRYLV